MSPSYWDAANIQPGSPAAGIKWGSTPSSSRRKSLPYLDASAKTGEESGPEKEAAAMRARGLYDSTLSPLERTMSAPVATTLAGKMVFVTVARHGAEPSDADISPWESEAGVAPRPPPMSGAHAHRRQSLPDILEHPKKGALPSSSLSI